MPFKNPFARRGKKRSRPKPSPKPKRFKFQPLKGPKSWFKKKTKTFRKQKLFWILFLVLVLSAAFFYVFKDLRPETGNFEKAVRSAIRTTSGLEIIDRSVLPRENWFHKWNEVHLLIQAPPGSSIWSIWERVKTKIPARYHLHREVITKTGRSNFIKAEFKVSNISFGYVQIVAGRKSVSSEYLEEEKQTVGPAKPFAFLEAFKPKPAVEKVLPPVAMKPFGAKPKVAIVLDDLGYTTQYFNLLFSLPNSITVAVLPQLQHSRTSAELARKKGFQVILHQPVEAMAHNDEMGPGGIYVNQSPETIRATVTRNLNSIPGVSGSNNHMGSRGTKDRHLMENYLSALKGQGMFYLDSYTVRDSVGREVARSLRVPYLKRSVFLDNEDSPESIRAQVRLLAREARSQGAAIGIGHYRKNTLNVLRQELPELEKQGIQLVRLRDLL